MATDPDDTHQYIFPDEGNRLFYAPGPRRGSALMSTSGVQVSVHSDEGGVVLAPIFSLDGDPIQDSVITVRDDSRLPHFRGGPGVTTLYVKRVGSNDDPIPIYPSIIDTLENLPTPGTDPLARQLARDAQDDIDDHTGAVSGAHPASAITGLADVATSGDYGDLDNPPVIPSTPGDIGAAPESHTHPVDQITGLSDVATSGSYSDLSDQPSIPSAPEDIGAAPESHTHVADDINGLADVASSGSYDDLSGAPSIPSTPEDIGADPAGTAQGLVDGLADVATSGSYNDLSDTPSIPSTPGDIGADPAGAASSAVQGHVSASDPHGDRSYAEGLFSNIGSENIGDSTQLGRDLITSSSASDARDTISAADENHTHPAGDISGLSDVATSGDYEDLSGTPDVPTQPSDIGAAPEIHQHGQGDITGLGDALDAKADLVDGLVPASQIPVLPTTEVFSVSSEQEMLDLDANRGDMAIRSDISKTFILSGDPTVLADWIELPAPEGGVASVQGKVGAVTLSPSDIGAAQATHSHTAGEVSGLHDVATSGEYSDLTGTPNIPSTPGDIGAASETHNHTTSQITGLAIVATSGDYGDLSNKPSIPSIPGDVGADPAGTAQGLIDNLSEVASTGSYDDLSDKPTIPSVPGDIGAADENHTHPAGDISGLSDVATSGQYADLTGSPSIPSAPGDVGAAPESHTHSASEVSGLADVATSGEYSDLSGSPDIPSIPSDIGAEPEGAASSAMQAHVGAADPHGDRSYTDQQIAEITPTHAATITVTDPGPTAQADLSGLAVTDATVTVVVTEQTVTKLVVDLPSPTVHVVPRLTVFVLAQGPIRVTDVNGAVEASGPSGMASFTVSPFVFGGQPLWGDAVSGATFGSIAFEEVQKLKPVAYTGSYDDLADKPDIPSVPGDIGAAPASHTHSAGDISGLSDVATSGDYEDLSGAPDVPTQPSDIGAEPVGAAASAIQSHLNATDPHGDRAWAAQEISQIETYLPATAPPVVATISDPYGLSVAADLSGLSPSVSSVVVVIDEPDVMRLDLTLPPPSSHRSQRLSVLIRSHGRVGVKVGEEIVSDHIDDGGGITFVVVDDPSDGPSWSLSGMGDAHIGSLENIMHESFDGIMGVLYGGDEGDALITTDGDPTWEPLQAVTSDEADSIKVLTRSEYDQIVTVDPETLYVVI